MKVVDILKNCAKLLNMTDVLTYLNDMEHVTPSSDTLQDVDNLMMAVNITNSNVASNYIEISATSTVNNSTGLIDYSTITNYNIIEIKSVKRSNGTKVKYCTRPDYIIAPVGELEIEFSYYPDTVDIDDDIDYYLKLNEIVFSMGVAGEYLFLKGAVDDAYMWDRRFKQMLMGVLRPKRNVTIPQRRWL